MTARVWLGMILIADSSLTSTTFFLDVQAAGGLELDAVLVGSNLPQPTPQARCSQWFLLAQELIFLEPRGPGQEQE